MTRMIARAPIVDEKSNLKQTQECLDKAYVGCQCDTFKIDNAFMYHILSMIFMYMDVYVFWEYGVFQNLISVF